MYECICVYECFVQKKLNVFGREFRILKLYINLSIDKNIDRIDTHTHTHTHTHYIYKIA